MYPLTGSVLTDGPSGVVVRVSVGVLMGNLVVGGLTCVVVRVPVGVLVGEPTGCASTGVVVEVPDGGAVADGPPGVVAGAPVNQTPHYAGGLTYVELCGVLQNS